MKKLNKKKGFTIVELVIVIAVIAILAAVLIPTFSGVIEKAQINSAMQAARNEYTEYLAGLDYAGSEELITKNFYIMSKTYAFQVDANGEFDATPISTSVETNSKVLVDGVMKEGTIAITNGDATFTEKSSSTSD